MKLRRQVPIAKRPTIDTSVHVRKPGACAMEWVSLLNVGAVELDRRNRLRVNYLDPRKTDIPACTPRILRNVVIGVNDSLSDSERSALAPLIPRLLISGVGAESDALRELMDRVNGRFSARIPQIEMMTTGGYTLVPMILTGLRETWPGRLTETLDLWDEIRTERETLPTGAEQLRVKPEVLDRLVRELART